MATGMVDAIYKLIFYFLSMKKHREKANNTGKTLGILSCSERGNPDFGAISVFDTTGKLSRNFQVYLQ